MIAPTRPLLWLLTLALASCLDTPGDEIVGGKGPPGPDATPRPADGAIDARGDDDDALGNRAGDAGRDAMPPSPPPCGSSDFDGDGFGVGPGCATPDCDDENPSIHPGAAEACNGVDDDCDDALDEGLNSSICGRGACRREVPNCVDGAITVCAPGAPSAEVCNGLDDDCDGAADEALESVVCGQGACQREVPCVDGVADACVPGEPVPETCDGVDRDCDGQIDEGHATRTVETRYSVMTGFHQPCDGSWQRIGPDCNAAIKRFCNTLDCGRTGFGPLENNGDDLFVACVNRPAERVDFATLAGHHPVCNGGAERIGPHCNAAIHRYCASRGFVSGFGPVESQADAVYAVCLRDGAEVVQTTYSDLVNHHEGCDGSDQRIGPQCNAAIHRRCASLGFATGYGPVENNGDVAVTVCLRP